MPEMVLSIVQLTLSLLGLCLIAVSAFGIGRPIFQAFDLEEADDELATFVWSIAIGAVVTTLFLTMLGVTGLLHRVVVGVFTVAAAFWGLGEAAQFYYQLRDRRRARTNIGDDANAQVTFAPPRWLSRAVAAVCAIIGVATLISALAPPCAGDALCYHLELPKVFLQRHAIVYLPFHENCTFPLFGEMLFLWGLACDGPVAAQLVAWGLGVLLALSSVLLATPLLGRAWAWMVGAVVLCMPAVSNQMTAPLCDIGVALWLTLALTAWRRVVVDRDRERWLPISALMLGAALSTKYVAMLFVAAVGANLLWLLVRERHRRTPLATSAILVLVVAMSIASPWYLRAWWFRGDPVYPFLTQMTESANVVAGRTDKTPLEFRPFDVLLAPWSLTFEPERFGGRGHQLGPLFLMIAPGLVLVRRLRGLGSVLAIAAAYGVLWYFLRQNLRFLLPIVPLLALASVWAMIEIGRMSSGPRNLALGAIACASLVIVALPVYHARGKVSAALGWQSRQSYLACHEPSYTAATVINRLAGRDARILSQDYRSFYFEGEVAREHVYRAQTHYDTAIRRPGQLGAILKERGFTHVVLVDPMQDGGVPRDKTLSRLVDRAIHAAAMRRESDDDEPGLTRLSSYYRRDTEGFVQRYRIYAIR